MNDQTLMDIVERLQSRFYGKYRGTVTDVKDDGRIRALVPSVLGDQKTGWCTPCVPFAGDQSAIAFWPEENTGVWIEFEGGDVSYPIWTGCYWHTGEMPSRVAKKVRVIKTKANQEIVLDDDDHAITITDSNGNSIKMNRNGIEIVRGSGKVKITDGTVSVNDSAMEVT